MDVARETLVQSLAELRAQLERHERLLCGECGACDARQACAPEDCRHRRRFCEFLLKAATIIDGTRKAFKSKQLEDLRKECLQILSEQMEPDPARPIPRSARTM